MDSRLPLVLRRNPGSVTDLLERLAGEPVDADIRSQSRAAAADTEPLELAAGSEVVERAVVLRGRMTGRDYVYAETLIAPATIPTSVSRRLEQTRDPIGRVLSDHGLVVGRQPLPGPAVAARADIATAALLTAAVFSRRYRILIGEIPAFAVNEWFLHTVADALGDHPDL
ncbi:MAG TPA: chorismate pyruvate-lyase family protein [Acidimicrobiales bacterium]|nr:chorismate pyruvate-lyase family protein [Acidimicrobiales bacterium]